MALKSFSIKIGADTKDFTNGLKNADKAIKSTIKEGKALKENLKLEYSTKGFEATQKTYQHALDLTNQKAQSLKDQLIYLENNKGVNTDGYYELQTKLAKANIEAKKLREELENLNKVKYDNKVESINKVSEALTKAGKSTAVLSGLSAGLLVGGAKLAKGARETGTEINKLATQYDMSAKSIQRWNYIALQTNVTSENIYKGIAKTRESIGNLMSNSSNDSTEAIKNLLGGVENLSTNSESAFNQIVSALGKVNDSTMQAYYAEKIFGGSLANNLLPLIKSGSGLINELSNEFETLGYISDKQVNQLAKLDSQMNKVEARLSNAKTQLGIALIPILEKLTDLITNVVIPAVQSLANTFSSLPSGLQDIVIGGLALIAVATPILLLGGKLVGLIGSLIKGSNGLKNVLTNLGTATGRAFIAVTVAATALKMIFDIVENWGNMSSIQKVVAILGTLTVVALGAAIAMGAFHSAWSLGLAVAGIIAGIVAVTAAVNSAKDSINSDIADFKSPDITSSNASSYSMPSYDTSTTGGLNQINNSTTSNDTYNINVETSSNASPEEIAEAISRKLAIKVQARS